MKTAPRGIQDLIDALEIIAKYSPHASTHCEHDIMMICDCDPDDVYEEDKKTLGDLGFFISDEYGELHFYSFRWGSC